MGTYKNILYETKEAVAFIRINRPERSNSINNETGMELLSALDKADIDDHIKVVVLGGTGNAFCAGADLKGVAEGDKNGLAIEDDLAANRRLYTRIFGAAVLKITKMDKPVIGMLNGPAVAAGFDIAMSCDMRIGCENTRLRVRFTSLGGVSAPGAVWLLVRNLGPAKAAEIVYTDEFIEPEEAKALGLLNKLVSANDLETETESMAAGIARHDLAALRHQKILLQQSAKVDLDTYLEISSATQSLMIFCGSLGKGTKTYKETRFK